MTSFARGTYAHGFCERCGFRYALSELKAETFKLNPLNNRVCPDCEDEDNPQEWVGTFKIHDPQALRRPAPDIGLDASRGFFGWNPVGNQLDVVRVAVGSVVVTT